MLSEDKDQDPAQGVEGVPQSPDDSVVILDVDEEDNNQYASIDELLMPSEDEMDQNITRGGHHISVEGVPQSLDDSVVILDVDEEERYTSSDDLLMSDAEFDHSRGEHQRGKKGGHNGLDEEERYTSSDDLLISPITYDKGGAGSTIATGLSIRMVASKIEKVTS